MADRSDLAFSLSEGLLADFRPRPRQLPSSWSTSNDKSVNEALQSSMPCAQARFRPRTAGHYQHSCEIPVGNSCCGISKVKNPVSNAANFSPNEAKVICGCLASM